MSALALAGVIISSSAMFVVLSGFSGLKNYSLEFISSVSPDLRVSAKKGKTFELTKEMKSFLKRENLNYGLSYEDNALLSVNGNSRIIKIRGVDQGFPRKSIDSILYQGRWFNQEEDEVVVGWGLAYDLGVSIMDGVNPATIYVPKPGKGQVFSENDIMRSVKVLSSGIFSLNEELNNSLVFCDLSLSRGLFQINQKHVGSIDIYGDNLADKKILSFFGSDFTVENQVQQNAVIYKMLNTEQLAIYLIFTLIVIVALFNMFGALMMMGVEKRENLKTLLILGATKKQVGKIFFFQGTLLSLVGCVIGLLLAGMLILLQQKFSLFMITPALAYPVVFELNNLLFVFFVVVILGGLASSLVSYYVKKSIRQISQK